MKHVQKSAPNTIMDRAVWRYANIIIGDSMKQIRLVSCDPL